MDNFRGLVAAVTRSEVQHRIAGPSAELAFFPVEALVPATVTVGGAMRVIGLVLGEESQAREEAAAVSTIRFLIGPGLGDSVIVPFVRSQLDQEHGGLALGGLLVTLMRRHRCGGGQGLTPVRSLPCAPVSVSSSPVAPFTCRHQRRVRRRGWRASPKRGPRRVPWPSRAGRRWR